MTEQFHVAALPAPDAAAAERPPIVVRRPAIDLSPGAPSDPTSASASDLGEIPRDWWGDDPFRTHFADALSSTFPFGEAFFVRSVQHYADRVEDPALRRAVRAFAGQEGQHSRLHDEHVELLARHGYRGLVTRNAFVDRIMRWHNRRAPRLSLAVTAAVEHLTAILARQLLENRGGWVDDMHPTMKDLWQWHALEEAEHKAVAFDVMQAAGIPRWMRVYAMVGNTFGLALETFDRMVYMLWKDGRLFEPRLWTRGFAFLFGRGGFLRGVGRDYRAWYRADFHPDEIDDRALIAAHAERLAPVISR